MSKGSDIATYSIQMRNKYGRYPAVLREWDKKTGQIVETPLKPLPGHMNDEITPLPDWENMKPEQKMMVAENRQDFRQRIRRHLFTHEIRKQTYSGELHHRINAMRIPKPPEVEEDGPED